MKPLLLLIDLQGDYLTAPALEPPAAALVDGAARVLDACRSRAIPVVHAWTTLDPDRDDRMPHWKAAGTWRCVAGTPGHRTPDALAPRPDEPVVHKTAYSAFTDPALDALLQARAVDTLVLAGVHLHACVAKTALDAFERGYRVMIVDDASGSYDPLHAAVTRRYLEARTIRFVDAAAVGTLGGQATGDAGEAPRTLRLVSPRDPAVALPPLPVDGPDAVARALVRARQALADWQATTPDQRTTPFRRLADRLDAEADDLARRMAVDVGKPLAFGVGEVAATAAMLRALVHRAEHAPLPETTAAATVRRRPLGVVGVVTPWNNPFYIPLGKIVPALLFGNAVVWKPAPAGAWLANRLADAFRDAGLPDHLVGVVHGDRSTAEILMGHDDVDAVTLTGSSAAGFTAQALCARRRIPLQAELGGNNAAVVAPDADLRHAAREIAFGAFAMAGQRCTANRRVVVLDACYDAFLDLLREETQRLTWGDPLAPDTQVGPLISAGHCARIAALVARATPAASAVFAPHGNDPAYDALRPHGTYHPPTFLCCDDPTHELVQDESFGPVLVVQRAADRDQALRLCNGVRQGLVAALFSSDPGLQARFLAEARAGILKLNRSTAGAELDVPFGGWKTSGIGPPEHGAGDLAFYTRPQTVYG